MRTNIMSTPILSSSDPTREVSNVTFVTCMSPSQHYDNRQSMHMTRPSSDSFTHTHMPEYTTNLHHESFPDNNSTIPSPATSRRVAIRNTQTANEADTPAQTRNSTTGIRRWSFLPLRRFNVHRFMSNMKRLHIIEVIAGCFMLFIHSTVLFVSLKREVGCFYSLTTWLIVLAIIACVRLPPQLIVVHKLRVLQQEWVQRSVTQDLVSLCKGPLCILNRSLAIVNFIWYFIGFRWAYYTGTCGTTSPFIFQYITVLILIFLALVGLNSVICLFSITYMLYTLCLNHESMEAIFQDIDRGAMPVPKRVLKRLTSLEWQGEESRDAIIALKNEHSQIDGSVVPDDETDFVCAICLCEYEVGQSVRILPCLHNFHKQCIDEWFRAHSTCPLRCHINLLSPDCAVNMQHCNSLRRSGLVLSPTSSPTATSRAAARIARLCCSSSQAATDTEEQFRTGSFPNSSQVNRTNHQTDFPDQTHESIQNFMTPRLTASNEQNNNTTCPVNHPSLHETIQQVAPSHSFASCSGCFITLTDDPDILESEH